MLLALDFWAESERVGFNQVHIGVETFRAVFAGVQALHAITARADLVVSETLAIELQTPRFFTIAAYLTCFLCCFDGDRVGVVLLFEDKSFKFVDFILGGCFLLPDLFSLLLFLLIVTILTLQFLLPLLIGLIPWYHIEMLPGGSPQTIKVQFFRHLHHYQGLSVIGSFVLNHLFLDQLLWRLRESGIGQVI